MKALAGHVKRLKCLECVLANVFPLCRHKQQAVVFTLKGMGFSYAAAVNAAHTTGANLEAAAQLLLDGG